MLDVFLFPFWTLFLLTWVNSLAVAKPTGASPNAIVARAGGDDPDAAGIQANPPKVTWKLAGGETIEFFAYQSIYDPPSANFYTAVISATKQVGQDCANFILPVLATCLKQQMTEKTIEFNDYSVWLSIENPDFKLTFGTLLLSLEAIGQFYLKQGKFRTHFNVYQDDPVYGALASGWIEKSVGNSGVNGTLPNAQGAIGNLTIGDASVASSGVQTA